MSKRIAVPMGEVLLDEVDSIGLAVNAEGPEYISYPEDADGLIPIEDSECEVVARVAPLYAPLFVSVLNAVKWEAMKRYSVQDDGVTDESERLVPAHRTEVVFASGTVHLGSLSDELRALNYAEMVQIEQEELAKRLQGEKP